MSLLNSNTNTNTNTDTKATPGHYRIALLVIILLSVIPYLNVLQGDFVFDDVAFYVDNAKLANNDNLFHFFTSSVWSYSNIRVDDPLYRPVTLIVMWITQGVFGENPLGHHLVNIVLHALVSLLLFIMLRRLLATTSLVPAFLGAALFAIHPVHVEAVSWISAFGHPLVSLFVLGSFLTYLQFLNNKQIVLYLTALLFFILALLTIEMAVCLPFLLTAFELIYNKRLNWQRLLPFYLLLIGYFVLRKLILTTVVPLDFSRIDGWLMAISFAVEYLKNLILPWPQNLYLDVPDQGISAWSSYVVVALLLVSGFILLRKNPDRQLLLFAMAWVILCLAAPVISAINTRPLFALRALYLPSIGLSILVAWAVALYWQGYRKLILVSFNAIVLISIMVIFVANRDWLNNQVVYEKILAITPDSASAAFTLGNIHHQEKNESAAERYFLQAVNNARKPRIRIDSLERLGLFYGQRGQIDKAEQYYRAALELNPEKSSAWVGMGNIFWSKGDISQALRAYQRAYRSDSSNYEACFNIGLAYRQLGDEQNAQKYFRAARQIAK